jgi:hypothetical protein
MKSHDDLRQIERLAYRLWEKEGRPPGRALINWLKAEKLLSEDKFLEHELEVEVEEGGLVPKA